jgi:hypothetical protein
MPCNDCIPLISPGITGLTNDFTVASQVYFNIITDLVGELTSILSNASAPRRNA